MKDYMRFLLDEKVVTCTLLILFSLGVLLLVHWHVDKEYVNIFGLSITTLVGSLVRGTTHNTTGNNSDQAVASTTVITPKP